mmetsp:Transcript_9537/g.18669  ORF Transcript_9537/g.18669 Transcript_9537/m.18669 type:complete len:243 (-) Transcript_9537:279-1007(-)
MHIREFDMVSPLSGLARLAYDKVIEASQADVRVIGPNHNNLHTFQAVTNCCVFDILTPPYRDQDECHFFKAFPCKVGTEQMFRVQRYPANDFTCVNVDYTGPPLIPINGLPYSGKKPLPLKEDRSFESKNVHVLMNPYLGASAPAVVHKPSILAWQGGNLFHAKTDMDIIQAQEKKHNRERSRNKLFHPVKSKDDVKERRIQGSHIQHSYTIFEGRPRYHSSNREIAQMGRVNMAMPRQKEI